MKEFLKWLTVVTVAVGGLYLSHAVAKAPFDAQTRSVPSVDVCQRYADEAEKELTADMRGRGVAVWSFSNGRAQAWALLYLGCRR